MDYKILPGEKIAGDITVNSDKSISHRALLFGAIADGVTKISGLSNGLDVQSTAHCLRQLGVSIDQKKNITTVHGVGLHGFSKPHQPLDAGNSGTTIRLLAGVLAGQQFPSIITGDSSLQKRPMNRIIMPLREMEAQVDSLNHDGRAPLIIQGKQLLGINYASPIASAQVKSCILLAGLYATGTTAVTEPYKSRDHTERLLADFGVRVQEEELTVAITGGTTLKPAVIEVPGDISSAAFFLAAAAIVPDSELIIRRVGLNPTRTGFIDVLRAMGARISVRADASQQNELIGDINISYSPLSGVKIAAQDIPKLIDEIPILAIIGAYADGRTEVTGAQELRVKESDRLHAVVQNLQAMGIAITEKDDGFIIDGPQTFHGAEIDSYGDHRIAMAFSIAGLIADSQTVIRNAECVSISMPNFFDTLHKLRL